MGSESVREWLKDRNEGSDGAEWQTRRAAVFVMESVKRAVKCLHRIETIK